MENAEFLRHVQKENDSMIAGMMGMHAQFTISDETMELAAANKPEGVGYRIHGGRNRRFASLFEALWKTDRQIV